jgi:hypothetical protein
MTVMISSVFSYMLPNFFFVDNFKLVSWSQMAFDVHALPHARWYIPLKTIWNKLPCHWERLNSQLRLPKSRNESDLFTSTKNR